jgi:hypothetical protein
MFLKTIRYIRKAYKNTCRILQNSEDSKVLQGKILASLNASKSVKDLSEIEFKVFSQNGEDGIIQYLLSKLNIPNEHKIFVEFGVGDYYESNTRLLLNADRNWRGLVIEGDPKEVERIKNHENFWKYNLQVMCEFITAESINKIINSGLSLSSDKTIGILSIDIDGNDYWVMSAIDCVEAIILICEFNKNAPSGYIQPYEANFMWDRKSSAGSSLDAIIDLAKKKKYQFVGTDSSQVNAFFVRDDYLERMN